MYADGVSMENIIKWADADENLVKAVIAEYKESRAQKKYMNERMPTCIEDGITTYTCKNCGDTYTEFLRLIQRPFRNIPEGSIFNRRFFQ